MRKEKFRVFVIDCLVDKLVAEFYAKGDAYAFVQMMNNKQIDAGSSARYYVELK